MDFLEASSKPEVQRTNLVSSTISTYSPSGQEGKLASLIRDELASRGFSPRIDGAGNVVCEHGKGATSILLCGHMDTVPGELEVKLDDGVIYGRGACDAKGALMSLLFAFEDLAESNIGMRLVFAGVTGEEQTSVGLSELIKNNVRCAYAIFGEPGGFSKITIGYRGHLTIKLEVETPEVHASAPKLTTNSVELMFEVYNSIKKKLDAVDSTSTDKISASITQISGGSAHNVIPGRATATVDVRTPVGYSNEQALGLVREAISDESRTHPDAKISQLLADSTDSYRVRLDSPLVRAVSRSILKNGEKPNMVVKSGTGDMNTYAHTFGIDAITYGPGDAKLSHTSDEHVSITEIFKCASILKSAVRELLEIRSKKGEG